MAKSRISVIFQIFFILFRYNGYAWLFIKRSMESVLQTFMQVITTIFKHTRWFVTEVTVVQVPGGLPGTGRRTRLSASTSCVSVQSFKTQPGQPGRGVLLQAGFFNGRFHDLFKLLDGYAAAFVKLPPVSVGKERKDQVGHAAVFRHEVILYDHKPGLTQHGFDAFFYRWHIPGDLHQYEETF